MFTPLAVDRAGGVHCIGMFIVVTGLKGGSGKSTMALHLAGGLASSGVTLLIDADSRNRTATAWAARGPGLPFSVLDERQAARSGAAAKATHIVIDSQAAPDPDELRASVGGADLVLVPVTPDGIGLDAALRTLDVLGTAANVGLVLSLVPPPPSRAGEDARDALADVGVPVLRTVIPRRAVYGHAGTRGVLVADLTGPPALAAQADVAALTREVLKWRKATRAR